MTLWDALLRIVLALAAAMVLGGIFERFRLSALLGYLLAGTLLGPSVLNIAQNTKDIELLAELGVALLLFSIGLEFSLKRLMGLGIVAFGGGAIQVLATGLVIGGIGICLDVPPKLAIAFGFLAAPSSTACVLRTLMDRAELESVHGRASLGILLMQDIAVVPLMLLMTALGGQGSTEDVMIQMGKTILYGVAMIAIFHVTTRLVLGRMLDAAAMLKNRELLLLLAVVTGLGATWAAHALGLSPALGAFAAGLLLAESPFATQIRADVGSLRTLFVTIFFVSIGLLADVRWMWKHIVLLTSVTLFLLIFKALITGAAVRAFRRPFRDSVATGLCLAQVGEFTFVLAGIGRTSGLLDSDSFNLVVSATLLTMFATPPLVAWAIPIGTLLEEKLGLKGRGIMAEVRGGDQHHGLTNHVVLVGMGPAGRAVLESLRERRIQVVVIEMNPRTLDILRSEGTPALLGDAAQEEVLHHADVRSARAMVITIPDHRAAKNIVHASRTHAPDTLVIVRARYHQYAGELRAAGAHKVLDEEEEMGSLLSHCVSNTFAASGEVALPKFK